jgi:hypothetical protein
MLKTEPELGVAIKQSIDDGVANRTDLIVTTKISSEYVKATSKIDISL